MNIMIVEDEALECEALKHIIETYCGDWFQSVTVARDGQQAVRYSDGKSFDLILMDINLPVINGIDAAQMIMKKQPEARIIMVSAYSDYEHLRESIRSRALDYIVKPYSVATLREAIIRVLQVHEGEEIHGRSAVIRRVKDYMKKHYADNITLSDIADSVNLDKSYLGRMFRDETGTTIMTYLKRIRLDHAKRELLSGKAATDVAISSGFGDLSYFSRYFKQEVGCSPMHYAKSGINKES